MGWYTQNLVFSKLLYYGDSFTHPGSTIYEKRLLNNLQLIPQVETIAGSHDPEGEPSKPK